MTDLAASNEERDAPAQTAGSIKAAIRQILLHDWDPIDIGHEPRTQDEYDRYIGAIISLLHSHASAEEIVRYLSGVERVKMRVRGNSAGQLKAVAEKLCSLNPP